MLPPGLLGSGCTSLNSDHSEKIILHFAEGLWMSMLQISKWFPEPENVRGPKGLEHNSEWIEQTIGAEMIKRYLSQ